MMRKSLIFTAVLALALLLPACSNGENGNSGATGFIGGEKGVELTFSNNAPPNPIADDGQMVFPVIVEATNRGEADVPAGDARIELEGFSYDAFNKTKESLIRNPPENITANRKTPSGEIIDASPVFTEFSNFSYVENVASGIEQAIVAKMCYEYESTTSTGLCIRDDMLLSSTSDPCSISAKRESSSSGAPVKITKVDQEVSTSDQTILKFTVKNTGTGKAFQTGSTCQPDRGQGQQVAGNVQVSFSGMSGVTEVNCRGQRQIDDRTYELRLSPDELKKGETFSCTVTVPQENRNNRVEPFTATLDYLYQTKSSKTLTIRNTVQ